MMYHDVHVHHSIMMYMVECQFTHSLRLTRGYFEADRVGNPFPLLKSRQNAWERCCEETKKLLLIRMEFFSHTRMGTVP